MEAIIHANPVQRCVSDLVTSSDEGVSRVYEITPGSIKVISADGPVLCCATHFEDQELAQLQAL